MPSEPPKPQTALALSDPMGTTATKEYVVAVLKGAIGAIPLAGTAINEALFEARSRLKMAKQVVQALVSKGLLVDVSFGKYDATSFEFVEPTELGARFLRWLQG